MVKIKMCGFRHINDVKAAVELGVDAIGFILDETSDRYIEPEVAAAMMKHIPSYIQVVGVFDYDRLRSMTDPYATKIPFDTLQCHLQHHEARSFQGFSKCLNKRWVPALVPSEYVDHTLEKEIKNCFDKGATQILLDSFTNGETEDWNQIAQIPFNSQSFILAGGLTASNVLEAMDTTGITSVDVCSGIEDQYKFKNPYMMEAFIKAARSYSTK